MSDDADKRPEVAADRLALTHNRYGMKKKIALTIFRYGEGIYGGTELHCRMLAERLRLDYDVEVLTTTLRVPGRRDADFPAGESVENGVVVRRFPIAPVGAEHYGAYRRGANAAKRLRYRLDQLRLLSPLASLHPVWTLGEAAERRFFQAYEEYSPALEHFVREHSDEYAAILPISYYFTTTIFTVLAAPRKCILIPTAHPEKPLYYGLYTRVFTQVAHIAFNTAAEQRLCRRIFGRRLAPSSIVGVGIESPREADWADVKSRFGLPERYVLYTGRMHPQKISRVIPDFLQYKREQGGDVKLVMVGPLDGPAPCDDPDVLFTGAVDDAVKRSIVRHATVMVNPSQMESLSLLLLEALADGVPMLVNGVCEVMKDHCRLSGAALWYDNGRDFRRKLHRLLTDEPLRRQMTAKGPAYVARNYGWDVILPKLRALIEAME